jgi:hypothetical protein
LLLLLFALLGSKHFISGVNPGIMNALVYGGGIVGSLGLSYYWGIGRAAARMAAEDLTSTVETATNDQSVATDELRPRPQPGHRLVLVELVASLTDIVIGITLATFKTTAILGWILVSIGLLAFTHWALFHKRVGQLLGS